MDFIEYRKQLSRFQSTRWTQRQKRLNALSRILGSKQYDHIANAFSQEKDGDPITGKRILLDNRRPSIKGALPKELVRDQCGLIFGEDHRPIIVAKSKNEKDPTTEWIAAFIHDTQFWLTMMDALWKGAVGSAVVVLRVMGDTREESDEVDGEVVTRTVADGNGRYDFEVWPGEECSPVFKRSNPTVLQKIDRRYFIGEEALAAQDYDVAALKKEWDEKSKGWQQQARKALARAGSIDVKEWTIRIVLDATNETWYKPVPRYVYERPDWTDSKWQIDPERTFAHEIGEMPAYWVRPLPINADDLYPDGACLFEDVIDGEFRINRTASQVGRAFDYSGDPQMARIKGKDTSVGSTFGMPVAMGGTASDIIEVDADGKAEFVEIDGSGLQVAIETYLSGMRDLARSAGAMSRVTPDSRTGAMPDLSSVAMKMLNFAQLTLSGILRETSAEIPGTYLIRLAMRLWKDLDIELPSYEGSGDPDADVRLEWQWPDYYEPHGQEKLFEVQAINAAKEASTISQETAVANTGPLFDVQSTDKELEQIQTDQADQLVAEVARSTEMAKVQAQYAAPATGKTGVTPKQ